MPCVLGQEAFRQKVKGLQFEKHTSKAASMQASCQSSKSPVGYCRQNPFLSFTQLHGRLPCSSWRLNAEPQPASSRPQLPNEPLESLSKKELEALVRTLLGQTPVGEMSRLSHCTCHCTCGKEPQLCIDEHLCSATTRLECHLQIRCTVILEEITRQ